jgi:hypothetical protein
LNRRRLKVSSLRKSRKSSRKVKKKSLSLKKARMSWKRCKKALSSYLSAARMAALKSNRMFMAGEATKLKQYRGSILKADLNCLGSQLKDSILDKNTAYVDTQASTTLKSRIKALKKRCQRMK